jgi:hypothetical protein
MEMMVTQKDMMAQKKSQNCNTSYFLKILSQHRPCFKIFVHDATKKLDVSGKFPFVRRGRGK